MFDSDTGALDLAWARPAKQGIELECLQSTFEGGWIQKHRPFVYATTSLTDQLLEELLATQSVTGRQVAVVMALSAGHMPRLERVASRAAPRRFMAFVN